jgi:hypothetical protein
MRTRVLWWGVDIFGKSHMSKKKLRRYAAKDELRLVGWLVNFFTMLLSLCYLHFTFQPRCGEQSVK